MTLLFPDLNVWLALADAAHRHHDESLMWLNRLRATDTQLLFSRYTQVGLLRLLTNQSVMGPEVLTLKKAWAVYDRWMEDPQVEFYPEPRGTEAAFRDATRPFENKHASKLLGDCYLLAFAEESGARLVTFDKALHEMARKRGNAAVVPG